MYATYFDYLLQEELGYDINNAYLFHDKKHLHFTRDIVVTGTYKVGGCTTSFEKRLSSYNTGCPDNEKRYFICLFPVNNYLKVEKDLKVLLKEYRQNNTEIYENIDYTKLVSSIKAIISI